VHERRRARPDLAGTRRIWRSRTAASSAPRAPPARATQRPTRRRT